MPRFRAVWEGSRKGRASWNPLLCARRGVTGEGSGEHRSLNAPTPGPERSEGPDSPSTRQRDPGLRCARDPAWGLNRVRAVIRVAHRGAEEIVRGREVE